MTGPTPTEASPAEGSPGNPFATRYVRPGALPFFFPEEAGQTADEREIPEECQSIAGILSRLRDHGWQGEIIGPHGTGKTTLLAPLLEAARGARQRVALFALRDGQRRLPRDWPSQIGQASLVAIDGYEQLGLWARWRLKRLCRQRGIGLVVTAHASTGLPTLYRTRSSLAVARQVVQQLLPTGTPSPSDDELSHLLDVFHGNLREVLFALYDQYEPRG